MIRRNRKMTLMMSIKVECLFEMDPIVHESLQIIDQTYHKQEPQKHQGQLWTVNRRIGRITSIVFIEPNDDIEDQYGTHPGIEYEFTPTHKLNTPTFLWDKFDFILYKEGLFLENDLAINHPLREFPHLGAGWDFKRNCLIL